MIINQALIVSVYLPDIPYYTHRGGDALRLFLGRPDRDRKREQGTEYNIRKYDKNGLLGIFTLTTKGGWDDIFF